MKYGGSGGAEKGAHSCKAIGTTPSRLAKEPDFIVQDYLSSGALQRFFKGGREATKVRGRDFRLISIQNRLEEKARETQTSWNNYSHGKGHDCRGHNWCWSSL